MLSSSVRYVLLLALFLSSPLTYAASHSDCIPIGPIPFVITEPGTYCLTDDIQTDLKGGKAITVKSDNVTIDFDHFSLNTSIFRKGNSAIGIFASGRDNLKIYHGTLGGWSTGIRIDGPGTTGNEITDMTFNDITSIGIQGKGIGLRLLRNSFARIGGSTRFTNAIPIDIEGTSPHIEGNNIRHVMTDNGEAIGLSLTNTENPVIQDNYFDTISDPKFGCGISLKSTSNALLLRNNFQNLNQGIVLDTDSTGLSNDTFMQGVDVPITGDGLILAGINF